MEHLQRLTRSIQGLVFWIGQRQSMFNGQHLPEAGLSAELFNLVQGNTPNTLLLRPEMLYRKIVKQTQIPAGISDFDRADLVLFEKTNRSLGLFEESQPQTRYVFEIKEVTAGLTEITKNSRKSFSVIA